MPECTKCGVMTGRMLIGIDGKCIRCLQAEVNIESPRYNGRDIRDRFRV